MNKYIYFSSENQQGPNPNSDFAVNFSDPIVINPRSQIRCVSIRINQNQNSFEIDEKNNILGFSIGRPWLDPLEMVVGTTPIGNSWHMYRAIVANGNYLLDQGVTHNNPGDEDVYLAPALQKALNDSVSNNSYFRGGFTVTITANQFLNIKLSPMTQVYEVPNGTNRLTNVPSSLRSEYQRYTKYDSDFNAEAMSMVPQIPALLDFPLRTGDIVQYMGMSLINQSINNYLLPEGMNYYISPSLNLTGHADKVTEQLVFKYYIDMKKADFQRNYVFGGVNNYVEVLGVFDTTTGIENKPAAMESVFMPDSTTEDFLFKLLFHRPDDQTDAMTLNVQYYDNDGQLIDHNFNSLKITSKYIVECYSKAPETNTNSYTYTVKVHEKLDGAADYTSEYQIPEKYIIKPKKISSFNFSSKFDQNINSFLYKKPPSFRVAIGNVFMAEDNYPAGKTNFTNTGEQMICMNVDPFNGNYGYSNNAWIAGPARTSQGTNMSADFGPLVIYSTVYPGMNAKSHLTNTYKLNNELRSWDTSFNEIILECGANFGTSLFVGIGETLSVDGIHSHGTGCQDPVSTIKKNAQNLPQQYLDCPSLPVNNSTGNALYGKANNFICPISYPSTNFVGTDKIDTHLYNTLENAYPLSITSLRLRICDLDGTVARDMSNYSLGVLEIRDNPAFAQSQLLDAIKGLSAQSQGFDTLEPGKNWQ